MRWSGVLFDLDGTLADTINLIVSSYQYALSTVVGRLWPETEIRTWIGRPLRESLESVDPKKAEVLFETYVNWNRAHAKELIACIPGVTELVESLVARGVLIGAATSKRLESAHETLVLVGLDAMVPLLVTHDDSDLHKPNPEPLLLAAQRLGCHAEDAVYIGDAVVDIQAAHAAGMDSIAVTWGAGTLEDLKAAGPTFVVGSVEELGDLLQRKTRAAG